MRIIINGRACSGKDAIADYLIEKYGFEKVSFATPIYTIARDLFDMKQKDRTLLITIGDKMREIDEDIFTKWALRQLKPNKNYVISDCRRSNEYKLSTLEGFLPIRVSAGLDVRIQRAIQRDESYPNIEEWEGHSETGADNCEYLYEIENNLDLENLHKQVDKLLELNSFKSDEDIPLPSKVKIVGINDLKEAKHLTQYIGEEGIALYSPITKKGIKRWKIIFNIDNTFHETSAYFRRNEFKVI